MMNGSMNEVKHPSTQGLFKRNVIIQKDGYGFGLTVSGDNPVYVQSVKEGSAAAKAGVQVGDQIIKVNGTLVTQSNHIEVVTLIKSGSYVALTLLGKDNSSKSPTEQRPNRQSGGHLRSKSLGNNFNALGSGPFSPSSAAPHSLPPTEVNIISNDRANDVERMLNQERDYNKTILDKYRRAPSPTTQHKLAESKIRITSLEKQLAALSGNLQAKTLNTPYRPISQPVEPRDRPPSQSQSPDVAALNRSNSSISASSHNTSTSSYTHVERAESLRETPSPHTSLVSNSTPNLGIGNMNEVKRMRVENHDPYDRILESVQPVSEKTGDNPPNQTLFDQMFADQAKVNDMNLGNTEEIICMEDGEFSEEDESLDQHGPFESLDLLKDKKAHLAVFLHYLISNSDPTPLFFWVVTEIYSKELKPDTVKEWKKWAYEIYSTFIAQSAPLKVDIGGDMEEKIIAEALNDPRTTDERLRDIFSVARSRLHATLEDMLNDFRMKRSIGLGGMFGDRQLEDKMDRNAELKIMETTLMPHLDTLLGDHDSSSDIQSDKNIVMASAIATLMKSAGLGKNLQKGTSSLDRCRSFAEKEKSSFMSLRNKRPKITNCKGHQFLGVQYNSITLCNVCNGLLWGIGIQGLQCTACEFNVHRKNCMENIKENCSSLGKGKPIKKIKPRSEADIRGGSLPGRYDLDEISSAFDGARNRAPSLLEEKSGTRSSDNDLEDTAPDSEKESESRSGTPHEEPSHSTSTTPSTKARTMGYRGAKKKDLKPATRIRIPGRFENGVPGQPPFPGRVDSPESEEEDISGSDIDPEVPTWSQNADKKIIKKLKSKEIKRQEVIHELLHTEKTHVRNLKILERVFYRRIVKSNLLSKEEIQRIFPNLDSLIEIHESLLKQLKEREKENEVIENVGDIMLNRFSGEAGEHVKQCCAEFCRNQKSALEQMKGYMQTRKDFAALMTKCEESRHCRRLDFAAILACTHHRLVKYPLLLENLNKATPPLHSDYKNVEQCAQCCRGILNYVNDEMARVEDELRLIELSKRIEDKRTIRDDNNDDDKTRETVEHVVPGKFNIMNHKFVYEGDLVWKINATKRLDLHVILLNDTLLLLTQQDEKYTLKNHGADAKVQSPVISLTYALIREVATDKKAFFLVSTSMKTPQIYELISQTHLDKKTWVAKINNTIELNKSKEVAGSGRRDGLHSSTPTSPPPTPPIQTPTTPTEIEEEDEKALEKDEERSDDDDEGEKVHKEKDSEHSEEVHSDDEEKPVLLSKDRSDNLNNILNENEGNMKKLIAERSTILSELHGPNYMESVTSRMLQPTDIVVSAIEQVDHLTEIFEQCSTSVSEDQRDSFSRSINGLHQCLRLLQHICANNRHDSYSDSYDGGKDVVDGARPSSKRTSSKTYSSDMTDSLPRTSPLGDVLLQRHSTSPPPILISDTSIDQDPALGESPKKSEDLATSMLGSVIPLSPTKMDSNFSRNDTSPNKLEAGSLSSPNKLEAGLLSRNDTSPNKLEAGSLITSPFKIQTLRKRTSDPSFHETASKITSPQHHSRTASFNMSSTSSHQTVSSDSES